VLLAWHRGIFLTTLSVANPSHRCLQSSSSCGSVAISMSLSSLGDLAFIYFGSCCKGNDFCDMWLLFSAAGLPAEAGQQMWSTADTQQGSWPMSPGTWSVPADGRTGSVSLPVDQTSACWHCKSYSPFMYSTPWWQ